MAVDIIARLKLSAAEFKNGLKAGWADAARDAEREGKTVGARFSRGMSSGLTALAAAGVGAAIGTAVSRSLDYAQSLKKISEQAGIAAKDLQEYGYAARQLGVEQTDFNEALQELTQKIGEARAGNKQAGASFADLGIDVSSASGKLKDTGGVLQELIARIGAIKDPSERARAEAALFGEEWRKIDPLLRAGTGSVNGLRDAARDLGIVLSDKQIQEADETARKLSSLKAVLEAQVARTVVDNSAAILGMANAIGAVANSIGYFFRTMEGVARIKQYEGFANGFFSSPGRQNEASTQQGYVNQLKRRVQDDITAFKRAEAAGNKAATQKGSGLSKQLEYNTALLKRATGDLERANARARAAQRGSTGDPTDLGRQWSPGAFAGDNGPPGSVAQGAGGARGASGAANDNAARAAERQARAAADLNGDLAEAVQHYRDIEEMERLRAEQGDLAVERLQAELDVARQFPALDGKRAGDVVEIHGSLVKVTQEMLDQLALAKQLAVAEVDRADAAQREAEFREEEYANAQEVFRRIRREREQDSADQRRQIEELGGLFEDVFAGGSSSIWKRFRFEGERALADLGAKQALSLLTGGKGLNADQILSLNGALQGAQNGSVIGKTATNILGIKGSSTGGAIGGAIGSFIPIPGGQVIGAIAGSIIGGLFKKAKYGTAVLTGVNDNDLSIRGNSGKAKTGARSAGGSVQEALAQIAEALDGDLSAFNVAIGTYKGKYRVSPSGKSGKLKGGDVVDFGKSGAEEAIRFAISDALSDGAIKGISDAAQRILKSGQDLDKAIAKAVDIESIPKLLKARLDPVGAALDAVQEKYEKLAETLKEGGASAEQIAQARQLWQLEREDTIRQIGQASQGLKDYLASLKAGPESPLSLRDQEASARAALVPFQEKIQAGQAVDQSAFQQAADTFLSIERQINGSTSSFFEAFNFISSLTERAISTIDATATTPGAGKDPFAELVATASESTATNTKATAQILEQQTQMLNRIDQNIAALAGLNQGLGTWLTQRRGFAQAA